MHKLPFNPTRAHVYEQLSLPSEHWEEVLISVTKLWQPSAHDQ